jgi:hypothetical protein
MRRHDAHVDLFGAGISASIRRDPGGIQLLLGPASSLFCVQMKVRCSRATSDG